MKKMKFKIIGVLLGLIIVGGIVDASTYRSDYFRLNNGQTESMESGKYCREIVNHFGKDIFIPLETELEFYNFLIHKPSGVTIRNRCFIADGFDKVSYENPHSYWHTTATSGGHIDLCIGGKCKNWYEKGVHNATVLTINGITLYRRDLYQITNNGTVRYFYYVCRKYPSNEECY